MKKFLAGLGGTVLAITAMVNSASAYVVSIDNFTVTKNGNVVLDDSFSDGLPPPSGKNGSDAAISDTYGVNGTLTEDSRAATMTTATGASTVFGGTNFIRTNAIFRTNTQPLSTSTNGLKSDDTLKVEGLFDMFIPATLRESYGVLFTDRVGTNGSVNPGNDQLEMRFIRTGDGELRIQFQRVNFVTQTNSGIQSILLVDAVGATAMGITDDDTLTLSLFKSSDSQNVIEASYSYFDFESSTTFSDTFTNTANIFNGEDFTRAGFFARVALDVPEPGTLALFGIGLLGLGIAARRRE